MTETMNKTHADAWGGFFGYSGPGTLVLATVDLLPANWTVFG